MSRIDNFLKKIPKILASRVSIFIYLFLFFYLVIFAFICLLVPALNDYMPKDGIQLILGNYTNVLSALGASIAAGSGVAIHKKVKGLHDNHQQLQNSLNDLHKKIDELTKDGKK